MPPRLSHKKSRRGCLRCKLRKVKCTEERPSCAACLRHSLPCHYPLEGDHLHAPSNTHAPSDTLNSDEGSVVPPESPYSLKDDIDILGSEHFQRRPLELRLLHHYVTVLARTLPASKEDTRDFQSHDNRELYAVDTVQVAFEYPFLLNTIFAISALHKTQPQSKPASALVKASAGDTVVGKATDLLGVPAKASVPTAAEAAEYARAHRTYLNIAIQQQREALMKLSPKNADAVCLNSVLLAFIALKILPEEPDLKYEPPVQWLSMAHAIGTVMRASRHLLLPNCAMRKLTDHPDFNNKQATFNPVYIAPFQAILDYPDILYPNKEEGPTYGLAVSYMSAIHRAIQNRDSRSQVARRIMSTGPVLPKLFTELVEQRRPRALVILAYIMSMSKYVDDYWFFRGAAEHEVYGIQSILPSEWQWAMEWPCNMLNMLAERQHSNLEI